MTSLAPITIELRLGVPAAQAWEVFTHQFSRWWPVETHSLSRQAGTRCALEATVGGAIVETAPDGSQHHWGEVLALEPGRSMRFSWYPGREAASAQWVDLSFDDDAAGSVLRLIHGGWEALGEIAPIMRQQYQLGWQLLLAERFVPAVQESQA